MTAPLCARLGRLLAILGVLAAGALPPARAEAPTPPAVDFNRAVRPVLAENCFACHGPDEKQRKAGLRLDTKDGALAELKSGRRAVVPGRPAESELLARITAADPADRMP